MQRLLSQLSVRLLFKGIRLITVESCTGGLLAKLITDMAGSSNWFECGLVTYSNNSKTQLVNVPAELIAAKGAVSAEVAKAMATGACEFGQKIISVSLTGIAGPDGGSEEKPVGTVHIAVCYQGQCESRENHFIGSRSEVREQAATTAINMLLERLA